MMNFINSNFVYYLVIFILVLLIFTFIDHIFNKKLMKDKIINFPSYISVLEYYENLAYEIIYKDQLLIYSVEGMRIDDVIFQEITKNYTLLVLKFIGPNLQEEFKTLYGDLDTLIFNIGSYFNTKYDNDAIRNASQEELMTSELNVEE